MQRKLGSWDDRKTEVWSLFDCRTVGASRSAWVQPALAFWRINQALVLFLRAGAAPFEIFVFGLFGLRLCCGRLDFVSGCSVDICPFDLI